MCIILICEMFPYYCPIIFFKYDLSIGSFPSKNRSSCSCNGFGVLAQNVQVGELKDLQRCRTEEYHKYQLRSKVQFQFLPLNQFWVVLILKFLILFFLEWGQRWTHLYLPKLTRPSNIPPRVSKCHLLQKE